MSLFNDEIFHILIYIEFTSAALIFISLFFFTAPYGRFRSNKKLYLLSNRAGWLLMEIPSALIVLCLFFLYNGQRSNELILFCLLWHMHYWYRTFYFSFKVENKPHSMSLLIALGGASHNFINSLAIGYGLFHFLEIESYSLSSPTSIVGLFLFGIGFFIHSYHDASILRQKKQSNGQYIIPQGGLFNYITSPNYFGELIQWVGFAMLTSSIASIAFALFTFANLFPRAIATRKWYSQKFKDFPNKRKAFFPFII